jgi:hypothetical protein
LHDRAVGRRAAKQRAKAVGGDDIGVCAADAGDLPVPRRIGLGGELDLRLDLAIAAAKIGAVPGDDKRDGIDVRGARLQLIERDQEVGLADAAMPVLRDRVAEAIVPIDGVGSRCCARASGRAP